MSGPLPRVPSVLLRPIAWGYGAAVAARNRSFDSGCRQRVKLDIPVISIGNVVVGGSGKTPVTAWIARRLLDAGRRPLIAMRGYGAKSPRRSDEVLEYQRLLPDVPVAAGADRVAAIERERRGTTRGGQTDVVLLDDGFQHRRLERDLDIVLVDAGRPCLEGSDATLLPQGWLREPVTALARADAVVLTHAEQVDRGVLDAIGRLHGRAPLASFRHVWHALERHAPDATATHEPETVPVDALRGVRVATLFGVAQPARVRAMAERAGAVVVCDVSLRDHQRYDARLTARIATQVRRADAILTTSKDWTKLAEHAAHFDRPVYVPVLAVEPVEGGDALMGRIDEKIHAAR